ncbi:MAG: hypothetical protein RIC18_15140 [Hoeflea sp.]|uniref:hypothetical protein n=1 Tax=Hoeflea sp. TaxID=1940281 RepID=UPI0032F01378
MTKASMTVILLALATALSSPVAAQTYEFDIRGNASTTGDPEVASERGAAVNFDFEAGIKLGLLLGEPLVSLRMRYELTGGIVTTPTFEPGEDQYETRQLDLLPSEAKDRLRLYNAKIRFTFDSGTGDAVELIADAGHLRPAGELSFNVPGSPDWDELFIVPGSIFQNGEPTYYNEASAQAIWASGLTLRSWDFEDISLTLRDMHRWYAENNERPRFLALQRAIRQVELGVKASYGYQFRGDSTDPLLDGISNVATWLEVEAETGGFDGEVEYDKQQWQEVLSRAEVRFLRLSSLPAELAIGGNHQPYQEAVRNARRLLFQTHQEITNFEPQGVDVSSFPKGREVEFTEPATKLGTQTSQEGDVKVWTIQIYIDKKGKGPKIGDEFKLGSQISRKGTVLSQYQVTRKGQGCTVYTAQFVLFMEGYVKEDKISAYSRNVDIYKSRAEAEERLKFFKSNHSYPLADVTIPKKNVCADAALNVPRP